MKDNSLIKLIEKLNNLKISQTSYEWQEDIPEDILKEYFEGKFEEVVENIDVDKHRWYETSITVLEFIDGFMGVRTVTDLFSENMDYSDCYYELKFFEMEEFTTTSYYVKK